MSKGRRSSYSIDEVLKQLEVGRDGATRIMAGSKPFHDRSNRARDIVMAIDELVEASCRNWLKTNFHALDAEIQCTDLTAEITIKRARQPGIS